MTRKILTERDRGFVLERALEHMALGWRVHSGPTQCRSGRKRRRNGAGKAYWRVELAR